MLFNSSAFLIFFPVVFIVYYIIPKKMRYLWLLFASYYFYANWNFRYIFLLLGCTMITYTAARIIEHKEHDKKISDKRKILIGCIILLIAVLGYFKYSDFFLLYLNKLLSFLQLGQINRKFYVILPVGISFYILQALGYVFDVYKGRIYAEKNFLRYALFVSFFPQLVAGPIERSKDLLTQLKEPSRLSWHDFWKGLLLILYGLFCKMVIADRIAIIVDTVYDNADFYTGLYIAYAAFLFSFQIYCDFYGYSTIARGVALTFGIKLQDNFNAPYYSKSIQEFWRRWHISLSSWFRDYLYIPLGGNRKGMIRKECNLLFVFSVSGLWHGASLSFIVWGFLNGFYQVIRNIYDLIKDKIYQILMRLYPSAKPNQKEKKAPFSKSLFQGISVFILITVTWIFFAAGGTREALYLIRQMFSIFNWNIFFDGSIYNLSAGKEYTCIMFLGIGILMLVDFLKYQNKDAAELVLQQGAVFKILCFVSLIVSLMLFGCYGEMYDTQQFIYFQF